MFYDLFLKESFKDFNELSKNEIIGGCIVYTNKDRFIDEKQDLNKIFNKTDFNNPAQASLNVDLKVEKILNKVDSNNSVQNNLKNVDLDQEKFLDKNKFNNHNHEKFNKSNDSTNVVLTDLNANTNNNYFNSIKQHQSLEKINEQNYTQSRIYTRLNIDYNNKLDQSAMNNLKKFNIVCICNVDNSNISSVIKLEPDLITLNLEFFKHMKKSFINQLKEKEIFVEIIIRDCLYGSKERILWMSCLRKLLKLGCYKNLVISSGASIFTELKRPLDILKILSLFGMSENKGNLILNNSERVLRKAALKRYSFRNSISNSEPVNNFKDDFIINYYK